MDVQVKLLSVRFKFQVGDSTMDLPELIQVLGGDVVLAIACKELGWSVTKLAGLHGADQEVLDAVFLGIEVVNPEVKYSRNNFDELIEMANEAAEAIWAVHGGVTDADLALASRLSKVQDKLNNLRKMKVEEVMRSAPRKGTAPRDVWPTRAGRRLAEMGDGPDARQKVEDAERERWIVELQRLLHVGLEGAQSEKISIALSRRVAKGRRAGTLRKHVKVWQKYIDWLGATFGVDWPENPIQIATYLEVRAAEPCGKSVPLSIVKTLMFMEHAAEIPVSDHFSKSPAVKNALEEVTLQLERVAPKERKQALMLPVAIVQAMEQAVMDEDYSRYVRAYAWFRLFKLWGGMRYHDTMGVDFSSIRIDEYGLHCDLKRTKTTGPGKKVTIVKVFVGHNAYLIERGWLEEGWSLWRAMAMENGTWSRDYFLQIPKEGLENCHKKIATYSSAAAMSQALFKVLKVPGGDRKLLEEGAGSVWSEHSERVTLRSWAGATGVPEDVCKRLGRWTPTVDQSYDRTIRMQVMQAQDHIARFIKRNEQGSDPFDEEVVLEKVKEKLEELGRSNYAQVRQAERLTTFHADGRPAKKFKWGEGDVPLGEEEENLEHFSPEFASESEVEIVGGKEDLPAPGETRMGHYVISVVGHSRSKTLHRVGECFRQPGIHYREFTSYGDDLPAASEYHRACKTCFPRSGGGSAGVAGGDDSSGSETVSSSSSSNSEV